jgi:hypothetical protein
MGILADRRQTEQLLQRWGPVIHLRDADASGVSRHVLLRQADSGDLIRIAKSAFTPTLEWDRATGRERFRLRSVGFGLCITDDAHLTGPAAALLLGLPVLTEPTGLPAAVRPGDPHIGHDRSPYGRVRHGHLPLKHRTIRSRVRSVDAAYCAIDIARHLGPLDGLVVTDAALHRGAKQAALIEIISRMQAYPGIATALWVAQHADPRCESPLESLGRHAFISAGLTAPLSNVWVWTGRQWFRVDHLLPDSGIVLEADGAIKYNNRPDADIIVTSEKERERLLRGLGFGVVRYTWGDAIGRPWTILQRVREEQALMGRSPVPNCWTLDLPGLQAAVSAAG